MANQPFFFSFFFFLLFKLPFLFPSGHFLSASSHVLLRYTKANATQTRNTRSCLFSCPNLLEPDQTFSQLESLKLYQLTHFMWLGNVGPRVVGLKKVCNSLSRIFSASSIKGIKGRKEREREKKEDEFIFKSE